MAEPDLEVLVLLSPLAVAEVVLAEQDQMPLRQTQQDLEDLDLQIQLQDIL